MTQVFSGLDVLCAERLNLLKGRRVGVLCHPASVDSTLVHAVDRLAADGVRPARLFGPEHGIRGEAQDMVGVEEERDRLTGIPVTSLYGQSVDSLQPSQASLADIDVLVIDLQDIGSRYYTFIWTMALSMQAAAKAGVAVVVLDRPNPIGGHAIEGGEVDPGFESFVGLGSVPVRHGLTLGEVARLVKAGIPWGGSRFSKPMDLDLTVVPMRGWHRDRYFESTGLPWVLPSPNMPTTETAVVYPGLCLIEGTNVSEGRGTTRPFEIIGAPFVDGTELAHALVVEGLPGVAFRPLSFRPTFHKFAGQICGGIQLHVSDRSRFQPYRCGVAILRALHGLYSPNFRWRTEPYEFVSNRLAIDLLTGSEEVRTGIESGRSLAEVEATWRPAQLAFAERRQACLLY
jgi:uncharacterized protein YbbC (DUF1343 family)